MDEQRSMSQEVSARERRRVYLWLGAAALLLRSFYFSEHIGSAFFGIPILDEKYYVELARRLLEGQAPEVLNPGFRPWLYAAFLASIFSLVGDLGLPVALAVQHLLGVGTTLMVCSLGMRLYRRAAAGWLAGGLYILAGPPLFFEGEVLITAGFTFLAVASLWLILRALQASQLGVAAAPWWWLGVGLQLGLAAQARPNILLLGLAVPWVVLASVGRATYRRDTWRRVVLMTAMAVLGCVTMLASFGLAQRSLIGRFQWLPQSGGINLYLGNKQGADGMQPRQDQWVSYGDVYRDSVQVFAEQVYRQRTGQTTEEVDPAVVSHYWLRQTIDEVRADPAAWGRLMLRKGLYLLSDGEIPNNKSYDFVRRYESTVLRWLPIRWGALVALAVLGCLGAWMAESKRVEDGPRFIAVGLYLLFLASGIWLFFVNGRYRMPLWPVLAALAAGGLLFLWQAAQQHRWRRLIGGGGLVLTLLAVGVSVDGAVRETHIRPLEYRDFFYRSLAHYEKGRLEDALQDAQRSVAALDVAVTDDAAVWFQQGNVALALGDDSLAFESYRHASELTPGEPRIFNNMGILHERRGRYRDAYEGYRFALALSEDYAPALVNLALLEIRAGLMSSAEERLRKATQLGDRSVPALCGLAFLARSRGDVEAARRWAEDARRRDAEAAMRILMELGEPLDAKRLGIKP